MDYQQYVLSGIRKMFCKNRMSQEDRQKFKLKMLHRYEDALEVRLAGIKAAKEKLEEQMNRDGR